MKDLVAKILAPRKPIKIKSKTYWVRQNIPWELSIQAQLVYDKIVDQYRFSGMFRRENVKPLLEYSGVDLNKIEELSEQQKDLQVRLYKAHPNEFAQKPIRFTLKELRKEIQEIHSNFLSLDSCTLENYAEKRSSFYILSHLIEDYKGRRKINCDYNFLERVYNFILMDSLSVSKIRELAHSDYWRNYWQLKKGGAFKHAPLTDEQLSLSSYSRMYDNIFKHPEAPEQDIINDDDLLDGWIITQNKEKNKKQQSFGAKIDSSKEVFIMAKNQEEANNIYSMNSDEQKAVQNVRKRQLKKQGTVEFGKLADQQRELMVQRG